MVNKAKPEIIKAMSMDRHRTMGVDRGTVAAYSVVSDVIAGVPIKIVAAHAGAAAAGKDRKDSQLQAVGLMSGSALAAKAMGDSERGSDGKLLVMKRPPSEVTQKTNMASVAGEQPGSIQVALKPELKKAKSIKDILLGFFGRRPTTAALEAKGILKKALVFGLSLEALEKSGKTTNGVVCACVCDATPRDFIPIPPHPPTPCFDSD